MNAVEIEEAVSKLAEAGFDTSFSKPSGIRRPRSNVNRKALEALLQKLFGNARLDLELKDRFGSHVEPREWFLVPLSAIDEAIQDLKRALLVASDTIRKWHV
jgi:hypothetical protein